ncbi:hypothetical protein Q1695_013433 [Nippostrongylus brasiliensis]|nr:hypothetical protein Q1695_013433 [Nippostrongylus brasiliensis]
MYTASTKKPGNLSQSALSYLQSLEKATKALRQGDSTEKRGSTGESSRLSSERGSLSLMISELREKTRKESIIDESDGDDKSTVGRNSHRFGKSPSSDSSSSVLGERIVFDFPFESGKEESRRSASLTRELPGLQLGRKSLSELRELRTSIDHSLIKPPVKQRQQPRRLSVTSNKESFDLQELEFDVQEQLDSPKKHNVAMAKSAFRPAIESGSDVESIDFEEDLPKSKNVRFEEPTQGKSSSSTSSTRSTASSSTKSSASTSTSYSTVTSSKSTSSSSSSTGSESSKNSSPKAVDDHESSSSSTLKDYESDFESVSAGGSLSSTVSVSATGHNDSPPHSSSRKTSVARTKDHSPSTDMVPTGHSMNVSRARPDVDHESSSASSQSNAIRRNITPNKQKGELSSTEKSFFAENSKVGRLPKPKSSTVKSNIDVDTVPERGVVEFGTQTEELTQRSFPEFCSSNLHHVTREVLSTHLQLLKEFNRLEWTTTQEWNAILDDIRQKYDGPSTQKLKALIDRRLHARPEPF